MDLYWTPDLTISNYTFANYTVDTYWSLARIDYASTSKACLSENQSCSSNTLILFCNHNAIRRLQQK